MLCCLMGVVVFDNLYLRLIVLSNSILCFVLTIN